MTRRFFCALFRLILRLFFRRIELAGLERVPADGPVIFVLNHPNGLIDPLFILCLTPRRVALLGKSTLFKMPLIGWLVRAFETIPVYRAQDKGEDVSRNRETFTRSRELLEAGGTLALFPEGVSHSAPSLKPLKTGAARIALGAVSAGEQLHLKIVPAGLYYTAKGTFRSSALVYFGEPISVASTTLDAQNEPPREAVRALSDQLNEALREVTLNADQHQALALIARAEQIFSAEEEQSARREPSLERELMLRQRFVAGYAYHREHSPARVEVLAARIHQYEEELEQAGLDVHSLSLPVALPNSFVAGRRLIRRASIFTLLLPMAAAGLAIHYPAYRLVGLLAVRFARGEDDILSTIKVLASTLLFPLTWIALGVFGWRLGGVAVGLAGLGCAPLAGYVAVRFTEEFDRAVGGARAIIFFLTRQWFFKRLLVERRIIRDEIVALGEEAAKTS